VGLFGKKTDDAEWKSVAAAEIGSIADVVDALEKAGTAVGADPILGWAAEPEIMAGLGALEAEVKTIQRRFKSIGAPRSSPELKKAKEAIDLFFSHCRFAFRWGKYHYKDASGAPGVRARYETGYAQRVAVKRVTNNGTKFANNALIAARAAVVATDLIAND
jgi:hypothetical protein